MCLFIALLIKICLFSKNSKDLNFFLEWKWAMDPPDMILNGALEGHYKMIKQMKGVPGVLPERYAEGFKVKTLNNGSST